MLQPLYEKEFLAQGLVYARTGGIRPDDLRLSRGRRIAVAVLEVAIAVVYGLIAAAVSVPILSALVDSFTRTYSENAVGVVLRGAYYKRKLGSMGKNVRISTGVLISTPENVQIGDYAHIDVNVRIEGGRPGRGSVKIGKYVHVAPNAVLSGWGGLSIGDYAGVSAGAALYSASNYYLDPANPSRLVKTSAAAPHSEQYVITAPIVMEENSFVGVNAVVLPGVTIGAGSWVGACAVVTRSIPAYCIAVGAPAKPVKQRPRAT